MSSGSLHRSGVCRPVTLLGTPAAATVFWQACVQRSAAALHLDEHACGDGHEVPRRRSHMWGHDMWTFRGSDENHGRLLASTTSQVAITAPRGAGEERSVPAQRFQVPRACPAAPVSPASVVVSDWIAGADVPRDGSMPARSSREHLMAKSASATRARGAGWGTIPS